MPALAITPDLLVPFGQKWQELGGRLSRTRPQSSIELGEVFNSLLGEALAELLGGIPVRDAGRGVLRPEIDCVEIGDILVVGGVRPQLMDVGYRPDGVRFAADIKTLNDRDSLRKNYANMVNDVTAEATTVHMRFPYAVVAFVVVVPRPCLEDPQATALVRRLEGLGRRESVNEAPQSAEAIALVVWSPETGEIDAGTPPADSVLRIEQLHARIERLYVERYEGSPPHLTRGTRLRVATPTVPTDDADEAPEVVAEGEGEEETGGAH